MRFSLCLLLPIACGLSAAEQPAPAQPPAAAPPAAVAPSGTAPAVIKPAAPRSKLSEEEKWNFEPPLARPDIFVDLETRMKLELEIREKTKTPQTGTTVPLTPLDNDPTQILEWAKVQIQQVESLIVARKWADAINACDIAVKSLEKHQQHELVRQEIEKLKRFRSQAEEAKIYEEAQAKFDSLELRVEGILWSPTGSLAVISGEPRARATNERVKDCVIINIDTNRVDFLFHYNRRRFEFQRYVGEDLKSADKAKAR